jgi:hypothetical protein
VLIGEIDLRNSVVLLDVDGTILDIAATPRDVVSQRLKRALKTLWRGTTRCSLYRMRDAGGNPAAICCNNAFRSNKVTFVKSNPSQ